jgi:hypothetical protein
MSAEREPSDLVSIRIDLENGQRVIESTPSRVIPEFLWLLRVETRDRAPVARSQISVNSHFIGCGVKSAGNIKV